MRDPILRTSPRGKHAAGVSLTIGITIGQTGFRNTGGVLLRKKRRVERKCSRPGCERRHYARGYCQAHYERARTGRSVVAPVGPQTQRNPRTRGECSLPGCSRPHYALSLCAPHYNYSRMLDKPEDNQCGVPGCRYRHLAKGKCWLHYWGTKFAATEAQAEATSRGGLEE
jgi:hypothetical protein